MPESFALAESAAYKTVGYEAATQKRDIDSDYRNGVQRVALITVAMLFRCYHSVTFRPVVL